MEKYTLGKPVVIKEKLQVPNSRFIKKYIYTTNYYYNCDSFIGEYNHIKDYNYAPSYYFISPLLNTYTNGDKIYSKEFLHSKNGNFHIKYTLQNPSMVFDGNIFNIGSFTLSNKEYEKLPENIKKNIRELLSKTSNACSHNFFKRTLYQNNDKINYLDSDDFERDYSQLWNSIRLLNQ